MRFRKAIIYWFYSMCLSFIILYFVQHFVIFPHILSYKEGFCISSFVELCIVIGLYDNIPSSRLKKKLEIIKKVYNDRK